MFISAGKAYTNRHKKEAPVHIAVLDDPEEGAARALCQGIPIAPIRDRGTIEVTCRTCQEAAEQLQTLLSA